MFTYFIPFNLSATAFLQGHHYLSPLYRWGTWGLWCFVTWPKPMTRLEVTSVGKIWVGALRRALAGAKWKFYLDSSGGDYTLDCQFLQGESKSLPPRTKLREVQRLGGEGTGQGIWNLSLSPWCDSDLLCYLPQVLYCQFPQQKRGKMGLEYLKSFL